MTEHKLLFAINHKATENAIAERVSNEYLVVGAITYRDAVISKIEETGADTLLIIDSLPGSISFERLLQNTRIAHPNTRIVVICREYESNAPFLQALVSLGIYDIINSDKPTISEICSYILTPRTIRDATKYGFGLQMPDDTQSQRATMQPPAPTQKPAGKGKRGFISDVMKGFEALRKPPVKTAVGEQGESTAMPSSGSTGAFSGGYKVPKMDIELLRNTIQQTEARKAQENLDKLIMEAVERQTAALKKENDELRSRLKEVETDMTLQERQSSSAMQEADMLRSDRDRIKISLEQTRNEMQGVINMYESQLAALHDSTNTPAWYQQQSEIWEGEKRTLNAALTDKTREAEELSFRAEMLARQVQESTKVIEDMKGQLQRAQDMQLSERGSEDLIAQLRANLSQEKIETERLSQELKETKAELAIAREGGPDYSRPLVEVPLLPDDTIYTTASGEPQTILMMGATHGIGATTVAMNLAASLALKGHKTLLVEVNPNYPRLNHYFELTHVPYGLEEALGAISAGHINEIEKAIIRPHGLRPTQANLYKTYKKLPGGLHFLLLSNESLVHHTYTRNGLSEASMYTMLSYLVRRLQYTHIILDIQCDDFKMFEVLISCGYPIDKLGVVLSQDSHSVAAAGLLITELSRAHAASLVASGEFIINRYNPTAVLTPQKIERTLRLGSAQMSKFTEDSSGYLAAGASGLPYIMSRGRFSGEYDGLRSKILPNS